MEYGKVNFIGQQQVIKLSLYFHKRAQIQIIAPESKVNIWTGSVIAFGSWTIDDRFFNTAVAAENRLNKPDMCVF